MGEKRLKTTKNKTSKQQGLKGLNPKQEHKPSISITRPTVQTVSRRSTHFVRSAALRVRRCVIPFYRHGNESTEIAQKDSAPQGAAGTQTQQAGPRARLLNCHHPDWPRWLQPRCPRFHRKLCYYRPRAPRPRSQP